MAHFGFKEEIMKAISIVLAFAFMAGACGTQPSPIPTNEPTELVPSATPVPPTPTITPSPTSVPIGGGGTIILGIGKAFFPAGAAIDRPFGWFAASSAGDNIRALPYDAVYGSSPDGTRMLVKQNDRLALVSAAGTILAKLDTGDNVNVYSATSGILWLSDGRLVFVASPTTTGDAGSIYVVKADGTSTTKLAKAEDAKGQVLALLFPTQDESEVYWVTGTSCRDRGICSEKYFLTGLDDSRQSQVWQTLKAASNRVYVSPSGKFIAYYSYFGWSLKNGCTLATIDGRPLSGLNDCYFGMWSPVEDKLIAWSWSKEGGTYHYDFAVWTEPGNQAMKLPPMDAAYCQPNWTPDGKSIFLSRCVDSIVWGRKSNSLGTRLIHLEDGTITKYEDQNSCLAAVSPDSEWAILYKCIASDAKSTTSTLINLKTNEVQPILPDLVSADPNATKSAWSLLWLPPAGFIAPVPAAAVGTAPAGRIAEKDGMVQVYVPAGEFTMGSDDDGAHPNEGPSHTVNLDGFWIDQTEVTNRMYLQCMQEGSCTAPAYYQGGAKTLLGGAGKNPQYTLPNAKVLTYEQYTLPDIADFPTVNVSWDQAQAYCKWAGRQLPTEAQWEKAARGTDSRTYPWGEQAPDRTLLNNYFEGPVQVGSYPDGSSPYGALDMAGNVWEYVADWYDRGFYANSPADNPTGPAAGAQHVVRGGAWYSAGMVSTIYRTYEGAKEASLSRIGFRCAMSN